MKKFLAAIAVTLFALSAVACSDKGQKADTAPAKPAVQTLPDSEAIVATYAKGQIRFKGTADGKFSFDMPEQCAAPPCKRVRKVGTMSIKRGKLYLDYDGKSHIWDYKFGFGPRTMMLSNPATGQSWTLNHVQ